MIARLFIIVWVLLVVCSCVDNEATIEALEAAGFTDVSTHGHAFFACAKGDNFATRFTATNPLGKSVSGVVCCGMLKNCTIRW